MAGDAIMGGIHDMHKSQWNYAYVYRPIKHLIPFLMRRYHMGVHHHMMAFLVRFLKEQAATSVVVFEGCHLSVPMAVKLFDPAVFRIVVMGYPNATVPEKMADIRRYDIDTPASRRDNGELAQYVQTAIDTSRNLEQECRHYSIPFIDTSTDFNAQIQSFADQIMTFLA